MDLEKLDFYFPFLVFCYGALMCSVAYHPKLVELAEKRFPPEFHQRLNSQRLLFTFCFIGGGLWSLQNWWLG